MKKVIAFLLVIVYLVGCSPSSEQILLAIGRTETAQAKVFTSTPKVPPTHTPSPTCTITPTPLPTSTPTPDTRIIDGQPKDLILTRLDLPTEGGYYLRAKRLVGRYSNEEVIGTWGREQGTAYLNKTGRLDGWFVNYERGLNNPNMPKLVYCRVEKFETSHGADINLREYNWSVLPPYNLDMAITEDKLAELDNDTISYISYERHWLDSAADVNMQYIVSATYHNFFISCSGTGYKVDVDPNFIAHLVMIIIDRMKTAPLINP